MKFFGKIVLVDFLFSDGFGSKPRPAVILTEPDGYGDVVLCAISSQVEKMEKFEVSVFENEVGFLQTGLLASSKIRVSKLLTLNLSKIKTELGTLSMECKLRVREELEELFA